MNVFISGRKRKRDVSRLLVVKISSKLENGLLTGNDGRFYCIGCDVIGSNVCFMYIITSHLPYLWERGKGDLPAGGPKPTEICIAAL